MQNKTPSFDVSLLTCLKLHGFLEIAHWTDFHHIFSTEVVPRLAI